MARRFVATPAIVKSYIDLFVNRRAFTLQSIRPHPESGRHYYYRPKNKDSGAPLLLDETTISDHLEGNIYDLAQRLGVPVKGSGLAEGIEVFPKHDEIQEGAFGNALRGPLGVHRGARRRFWFYGADYSLEAQIYWMAPFPI